MSDTIFVLSQDCWRWRLVQYDGDDQTEVAHSEGAWFDREGAVEDLEKLRGEHPDAELAEDRMIVERTVRARAPAVDEDAAYKRGYQDAKRQILESLK